MRETERLEAKRSEIFDAIACMLCEKYGLGQWGSLHEEKRSEIADEVDELVENWDIADNDLTGGLALPNGSEIQKLLAEYHEIGERLLDVLDDNNPKIPDA